jgi:hypothetical protein
MDLAENVRELIDARLHRKKLNGTNSFS